jgi:hypothetical protein
VQWTGGYAPRFQAFFVALDFFRFDSESRPSHLRLTHSVGRLNQNEDYIEWFSKMGNTTLS